MSWLTILRQSVPNGKLAGLPPYGQQGKEAVGVGGGGERGGRAKGAPEWCSARPDNESKLADVVLLRSHTHIVAGAAC